MGINLALFFVLWLVLCWGQKKKLRHGGGQGAKKTSHTHKSVFGYDMVDKKGAFSILSMNMEHHTDGSWVVPSLHNRGSAGWNRTLIKGNLMRPYACTIQIYALGLESILKDFMRGGTGYLQMEVKQPGQNKRSFWYGFDSNELNKLHCYYMTSKGYGSEFQDNPKTLGIAVSCPVSLDLEVGEYEFRKIMEPGFYCRSIADNMVKYELHLRPDDFEILNAKDVAENPDIMANMTLLPAKLTEQAARYKDREIVGEFGSGPVVPRLQAIRETLTKDPRSHAVVTVQTFKNQQTGPMLYAFVAYYHALGWKVIVYDRFGQHSEYVEEFVNLPGVDYHPYTVFQMVNPGKYNSEYAAKQGTDRKFYYKMEKNWGFTGDTPADTADQDQDKTRTLDHARVEYAHIETMLYIDADELFYCPQAGQNIQHQRQYQQKLMSGFYDQGIEEMRFVRLPYSGKVPTGRTGFNASDETGRESRAAFTANTQDCMEEAFKKRSVAGILSCWSTASAYDNFPKSADLGRICPFHYNHWSCDGMRNGGRDYGKGPRCRCKVAFDMINGFEYKPLPNRCHLMHLNDDKYAFQSNREKHRNDLGDVKETSVLAAMFAT